jgi:YbbR domain-containing protein
LDSSKISIPLGAEIKDFSPSQVHLRLEMKREIMMEVKPELTGGLKKGLQIEKIEVIPSQLLVEGPESKINENSVIRTYPLDISLLTETTEIETDIILPNPDLNLVYPETKVKVRIIMKEYNSESQKLKDPK